MNKPIEYTPLTSKESCGNYGWFAIKIEVAAGKLPNLKQDAIRDAAADAMDKVEDALLTAIYAANPEEQARAVEQKTAILGLFSEPIHVETIPNGYCPRWCCKHLPWFIVTTRVGRIKIGWRKRVLLIDWADTKGTKTVVDLFANEDVTKSEKMIHAWSYGKAKQYLDKILTI